MKRKTVKYQKEAKGKGIKKKPKTERNKSGKNWKYNVFQVLLKPSKLDSNTD